MLIAREHLKQIYQTTVNSVKPDSLIKNFICFSDTSLIVKSYSSESDKIFPLKNRDVYIIGAGKAVLKMCDEFLRQLNMSNIWTSLKGGILSIPFGTNYDFSLLHKYNITYNFGANNNIPDENSVKCTQDIVSLIRKIKNSNENYSEIPLIIAFISGGGSALLSLPKPSITLKQKCALISDLVKSGANINELNSVRRCVSEVKGGKLSKLAISPPNRLEVLSFIMSDIIKDPIELIASGPTVIDNSDIKHGLQAISILNKYNVKLDDSIRELILSEDLELNAKELTRSNLITNIVIGNNTIAINAGKQTAAFNGYKVIDLGNQIEGEAKDIAENWCEIGINFQESDEDFKKYKGICWIGGGETTVNMNKCTDKIGIGGRCQEMGLAFCHHLNQRNYFGNLLFLAAGTDGQDGPTNVAGVIVDSSDSKFKDPNVLHDLTKDLKNHNSHNFFLKNFPNWFVDTGGVTGTNVMDIYCMIKYFNK